MDTPKESLAFDHVVLGQAGYLTHPEAAKAPGRAWLAPVAARGLGKVQAPVAAQRPDRDDHAWRGPAGFIARSSNIDTPLLLIRGVGIYDFS